MTATYLDGFEYGLYKSTNGGGLNRITSINKGSTGASDKDRVNDIEIQTVSNRIWLSTKSSVWSGNYGGRFWYNDDGSTFTKNPTFPAYPEALPNRMYRTEIAPSHQDTDTHYVLMRVTGTASGTIPLFIKLQIILQIYHTLLLPLMQILESRMKTLLEVNHGMI